MKNAVIAGASGLVGSELLTLLLGNPEYEQVIAVVRNSLPLKHPKFTQLIIDFDDLSAYQVDVPVDEVFCCLGTTIKKAGSQAAFQKVDHDYVVNLGRFCETNAVNKFLVVSAMGASSSSGIFYNRVKGEMENAVFQMNIPVKIILRPSLLLGRRSEFRFGELMAQLVMSGLGFLFIGGLKKYKGVKAKTVARAMIALASSNHDKFLVVDSAAIQEIGSH